MRITRTKTLAGLLEEYLATNPRVTSERTGSRYRTVVRSFCRCVKRDPAMAHTTMADVTEATLRAWAADRAREVSAATLRGECEKMRSLLRWWSSRTGRPAPPVPRTASGGGRSRIGWTEDELATLVDAAGGCRWTVGRVPASVFWPAIVGLLAETSASVEDALTIDADAFDFERQRVTLTGGVFTLTPPTVEAVRRLVEARPCRPFAPVGVSAAYRSFRRLVIEAGLADRRRAGFAAFRGQGPAVIADTSTPAAATGQAERQRHERQRPKRTRLVPRLLSGLLTRTPLLRGGSS